MKSSKNKKDSKKSKDSKRAKKSQVKKAQLADTPPSTTAAAAAETAVSPDYHIGRVRQKEKDDYTFYYQRPARFDADFGRVAASCPASVPMALAPLMNPLETLLSLCRRVGINYDISAVNDPDNYWLIDLIASKSDLSMTESLGLGRLFTHLGNNRVECVLRGLAGIYHEMQENIRYWKERAEKQTEPDDVPNDTPCLMDLRWFSHAVAATWPAGSVVMIRKNRRGDVSYSLDTFFRADHHEVEVGRGIHYAYALIDNSTAIARKESVEDPYIKVTP